ncbi:heat-shock protein Hsp20 [Clostridium sp. chh4-2]|uniref:Hsp20/alpha crystallin family protein n=1 Tax=Clostridium sp. chh4-2 TaxID=2067550 RepID=UPI000CCF825C|nr:Hsp20/alpha crystallin family protein [Clostridium sp. chh4-2]PNV60866.1 heat-shock protein Hsp20 [Clostridium sp. chh4-2]
MLMPDLLEDRFFNDFMDFPFDDRFEKKLEKEFFGSVGSRRLNRWMKTDVRETKDGYELEIDLPGFKKDEVNAQLHDGYLTISAVKGLPDDGDKKRGRYLRRERYAGACRRTFYVGDNVDEEKIKAKFKHGILKLSIPKKEEQPMVEDKNYIEIDG